jgi:prepilin-type N-terminal cleavage/methylation domain-containing protein
MAAMRTRGFTLVELMVTVVIVGVLSGIAMVAYSRYMRSARKSEVIAVFGEIRLKEEAYRAEFSSYLSTTANEATLYPTTPDGTPQLWATPPAAWGQLGLTDIGRKQVYCGYNIIAGVKGVAPAGASGAAWWGGVAPRDQWWYATAQCDNDRSGPPNATFLTSSDNIAMSETNPQQ